MIRSRPLRGSSPEPLISRRAPTVKRITAVRTEFPRQRLAAGNLSYQE
ncbi:hypothetical protein CKO_02590 [Citrobacter koseri ATCC BAA-895]|uniref:Uncharacterized protein n=1 Tax=Citrobacter koseri (strain ATCC BAA-895 / CDC 4225-83 / SGSC4696) TaxID=290338 RepID=A8AJN6_CITK8|nr:hypothetical protein CKO_02590 [Citrobacter koseri ATCC BAA-895]